MTDSFRVFIVEDNALLRENLHLLLDGERTIEVAGLSGSAEEAEQALEATRTDVVLCDLGLPGISGIELIGRIKRRWPEVEVMAYTVFEDRATVFSAIKAGATSYILKGATPRELVEALTGLNAGGAPMSPKIARSVVREVQGAQATDEEYLLSARERDVLSAIDQGLSYKQAAAKLNISVHTVHSHIKKIYERLHASGKREALIKARRKGLL